RHPAHCDRRHHAGDGAVGDRRGSRVGRSDRGFVVDGRSREAHAGVSHPARRDRASMSRFRVQGSGFRVLVPVLVLVLVLVLVPVLAEAPVGFDMPAPTGPYAVGTTAWRLVDGARPETFGPPGAVRNVEVLAWYPAAARRGGTPAPYLREGLDEVRSFAKVFRVPDTTFDPLASVRAHATVDAPPAAQPRKLPILLFSAGFTGIPSASTALVEDLASHGYAVLNVVHPYEMSAATLADGRIVSMLDATAAPLQPIRDVFAEWAAEDDAMAAVTREKDEREQIERLRGYLSTLKHTDMTVRRWVDDTKLVLDRLASLPARSAAAQLAARLDPARVGVFGHSMGGVVAGQFCVDDRRCRAALNLDGIPQYGTMIDASMRRPFLMIYSARPGRLGASDAIYRRAARPYYRVDVRDTRHLDFCD